ncbi:MAG TPA: prolyl oligopeptidase family serine peptidase [Blastocatellia bacterium]|nr:prolyl oligopeptidase family serine peptidase [Blastocatellia bacterium]
MHRRLVSMSLPGLIVIAMLAPLASRGLASPAKVPEPLSAGPFAVGVTRTVFVDKSRTDNVTKGPRTLVTEIWYPAADDARNMAKNRYSDFIPGRVTPELDAMIKMAYRMSIGEIDKLYWNEAVRDAKVRKGRFPLIVFSHGNGGTRFQNTFWCDYLASHGYIIVSADHTGNARLTIIDGKPILYQASERAQSAKDRPLDMRFLLDQMVAWDKGADKRFAGHIDTNRACAAGMSFGSYTAIAVADQEPRFKAVIAMSGAPDTHTNLTVPSLRMIGTEDRTINEAGNARVREHHATHTGPSYLLELKNGGHYSFTDMFKINKSFGDGVGQGKRRTTNEPFEFTAMEPTYRIINSYSVAFLGYYLKGEKGYAGFLRDNRWPDILIWDAKDGVQQAAAARQKAGNSR